jgi:hypothetical protein
MTQIGTQLHVRYGALLSKKSHGLDGPSSGLLRRVDVDGAFFINPSLRCIFLLRKFVCFQVRVDRTAPCV